MILKLFYRLHLSCRACCAGRQPCTALSGTSSRATSTTQPSGGRGSQPCAGNRHSTAKPGPAEPGRQQVLPMHRQQAREVPALFSLKTEQNKKGFQNEKRFQRLFAVSQEQLLPVGHIQLAQSLQLDKRVKGASGQNHAPKTKSQRTLSPWLPDSSWEEMKGPRSHPLRQGRTAEKHHRLLSGGCYFILRSAFKGQDTKRCSINTTC